MNRVRWIDRLTRRTVVVHMTHGASVRGVLVGTYRDCLVLTHAAYLGAEAIEKVDGEVIVPRERVAWMQTLEDA
jgi:hypothetical protein